MNGLQHNPQGEREFSNERSLAPAVVKEKIFFFGTPGARGPAKRGMPLPPTPKKYHNIALWQKRKERGILHPWLPSGLQSRFCEKRLHWETELHIMLKSDR
jgi:hypothetical protein